VIDGTQRLKRRVEGEGDDKIYVLGITKRQEDNGKTEDQFNYQICVRCGLYIHPANFSEIERSGVFGK